jgi:ketosteroid isomerase-like protein
MTDDEELAREAYAAFNRGDMASILQRLDPDIEWRMSAMFSRDGRVFHGHDGVRAVFAIFEENFDDFRTEPLEYIPHDGRLVVPVRLHGREKGGGAPVEIDLVQVWTMRDGRAARLDVYLTKEEAFAASDETPD